MAEVLLPFHWELAGQFREYVTSAVGRSVVQDQKPIDALIQMVQNVRANDVRLVPCGTDCPDFQTTSAAGRIQTRLRELSRLGFHLFRGLSLPEAETSWPSDVHGRRSCRP